MLPVEEDDEDVDAEESQDEEITQETTEGQTKFLNYRPTIKLPRKAKESAIKMKMQPSTTSTDDIPVSSTGWN